MKKDHNGRIFFARYVIGQWFISRVALRRFISIDALFLKKYLWYAYVDVFMIALILLELLLFLNVLYHFYHYFSPFHSSKIFFWTTVV